MHIGLPELILLHPVADESVVSWRREVPRDTADLGRHLPQPALKHAAVLGVAGEDSLAGPEANARNA